MYGGPGVPLPVVLAAPFLRLPLLGCSRVGMVVPHTVFSEALRNGSAASSGNPQPSDRHCGQTAFPREMIQPLALNSSFEVATTWREHTVHFATLPLERSSGTRRLRSRFSPR